MQIWNRHFLNCEFEILKLVYLERKSKGMKKILLATPTMHKEEEQYIQKVFDTNWISP